MDSEPRWLDIEDELYPEIVMMKQIVFENVHNGGLTQYFTEIKYNSFKREIDLTPLVFKYFIENNNNSNAHPEKNSVYEILIRDKLEQKLYFIGYFPHDDSYALGQNFLSEEILYIIVKKEQKVQQNCQLFDSKQVEKQQVSFHMSESQPEQEEKLCVSGAYQMFKEYDEIEEISKAKPNKRRSIEQILKIIAEWRKLIMIKKLSSSDAADKVGMSKRSLEDYFTIIKLAEKYGFDFQNKMKNAFAQLRNFVKENHQIKLAPKVQILEKFKSSKK